MTTPAQAWSTQIREQRLLRRRIVYWEIMARDPARLEASGQLARARADLRNLRISRALGPITQQARSAPADKENENEHANIRP